MVAILISEHFFKKTLFLITSIQLSTIGILPTGNEYVFLGYFKMGLKYFLGRNLIVPNTQKLLNLKNALKTLVQWSVANWFAAMAVTE